MKIFISKNSKPSSNNNIHTLDSKEKCIISILQLETTFKLAVEEPVKDPTRCCVRCMSGKGKWLVPKNPYSII